MTVDDVIAEGPKRVIDDAVALDGFGLREKTTQLPHKDLILI